MENKKIDSPQHLYVMIKDMEFEDINLSNFRDYMFQFLEGCPCDAEENFNKAISFYKRLNTSNLDFLKNSSEYLDIYLNGEIILTI